MAKKEAKESKKDHSKNVEDEIKKTQPNDDTPPTRPDMDSHREKINEIESKIDKVKSALDKVTKELEAKSGATAEDKERRNAIHDRMQEYDRTVKELHEKRTDARKELDNQQKELDKIKNDVGKAKAKLNFNTVEEVDETIKTLNHDMMTNSFSMQEERKMVDQIKELERYKPKLLKANQQSSQLTGMKSAQLPVRERLDQISKQIKAAMDLKKVAQKELAEEKERKEKILLANQDIVNKRKDCQAELSKLQKLKKDSNDQFYEKKRAWDKHQQVLLTQRWAAQEEERKARQEEWKKEKKARDLEKIKMEPYFTERQELDAAISYCKSLLPKDTSAQAETKTEAPTTAPNGMMVVKKKQVDMFCAPKAKKMKEPKAKKAPVDMKKPLKLTGATMSQFAELKVSIPTSTADLPGTIEILQTRRAEFEKKVADWRRKLEDGTLLKDFEEQEAAATRAEEAAYEQEADNE